MKQQVVLLIGPLALLKTDFLPSDQSHSYIFIDGGTRWREMVTSTLKGSELFSLGDGDSGHSDDLEIVVPQKKDASDYALTLEHYLEHYKKTFSVEDQPIHFHLYGFWGERLDHTLALFGENFAFMKKDPLASFSFFNKGLLSATQFKGKRNFNFEGTFSVFTMEEAEVTIQGSAEYCGRFKLAPFSSHGLSNIGRGPFEISSDSALLISFNP